MNSDACTICGHAGATIVPEVPRELGAIRDEVAGQPLCRACATGDVPSPCVNACRLDGGSNLCLGCGRTMDEVTGWGHFDALRRASVWRRLRALS